MLLSHDNFNREAAAILFDFYLLPLKSILVQIMLEMGARYAEEVRAKGKGHKLGSPWVHQAIAFLEEVAKVAGAARKVEVGRPSCPSTCSSRVPCGCAVLFTAMLPHRHAAK